jgi:hypothetical protein
MISKTFAVHSGEIRTTKFFHMSSMTREYVCDKWRYPFSRYGIYVFAGLQTMCLKNSENGTTILSDSVFYVLVSTNKKVRNNLLVVSTSTILPNNLVRKKVK